MRLSSCAAGRYLKSPSGAQNATRTIGPTIDMALDSSRASGAALRTASETDEAKTEMLKVDIKLSTEVIIELREACGRSGEIPVHWKKAPLV